MTNDPFGLALLGEADRLLAECATPIEARELADRAAAIRDVMKRARLGASALNRAMLVRIRAEILVADLVDAARDAEELVDGSGGRPETVRSADGSLSTLRGIGINRQRLLEARLLREMYQDDGELERIVDDATAKETTLSRRELLRDARRTLGGSTTSDDWYSPRWLFDQLDLKFDVDVCAPENPEHRNVPARRYLTLADDGLSEEWSGLVWCNPPYSHPEPWISRWIEHPEDCLMLVGFAGKSARMLPLWDHAEALILFTMMAFDRPDGKAYTPFLEIQLLARGDEAVEALSRIDHPTASPIWYRRR